MARLPVPGSDQGQWGEILNEYLLVSHEGGGRLKSSSVSTAQLENGSVATAKLQDGATTTAKLADGSVTGVKLADGAVSSAALADGVVSEEKLSEGVRDKLNASETNDAEIAALIANSTSATYQNIQSIIPRWTPAPRNKGWATLGDSITSYNGPLPSIQPAGWFWSLVVRSTGRITPEETRAVFATGGFKLQQIIDTHLPQIEALQLPPAYVICAGGSNDLAEGDGTVYQSNSLASQARILEIIKRITAIGAVPILVKVPPRANSAQIAQNVIAWNTYIETVSKQLGLQILDMFTPLSSNISNGGSRKPGTYLQNDSDPTHPNPLGHSYIARANTHLYNLSNDSVSVARSTWEQPILGDSICRFLTDSNADGLADGWSVGGSASGVTFSRDLANGPLESGYWQRINIPAGTGQGWIQVRINEGWTPGDRIRIQSRIRVEANEPSTDSLQTTIVGLAGISPSLFAGSGTVRELPDGETYNILATDVSQGSLYARIIWPSGTTQPMSISVANVRITNLSKTPNGTA